MFFYVICCLISNSLHGWKYKDGDNSDKFYAGFVTLYGVVGFELDMCYWDDCIVPIIYSKPNFSDESNLEILRKYAETNIRFASKEMLEKHYKVVNEEILSKMDSDAEIGAYLSFYEPIQY